MRGKKFQFAATYNIFLIASHCPLPKPFSYTWKCFSFWFIATSLSTDHPLLVAELIYLCSSSNYLWLSLSLPHSMVSSIYCWRSNFNVCTFRTFQCFWTILFWLPRTFVWAKMSNTIRFLFYLQTCIYFLYCCPFVEFHGNIDRSFFFASRPNPLRERIRTWYLKNCQEEIVHRVFTRKLPSLWSFKQNTRWGSVINEQKSH